MTKPVVLVAEKLSPAGIALLEEDFEVRHVDGADRSQLLPALADVDALIVRSATQFDAEAVAAANRLQVVARAGVGLDNVDVDAATKAGVLVVNAPTSNIISAAEQAINLLLASARNTAPAHNALINGEWKRSKYTGVELYEKVVGVVGLGRIGALVAQRLLAFGTKVIAYDPFVQPARAAQIGVEMTTLDDLLERSDFITIHLPKNKDTVGLIGDEALSKVKPSVRVINAARGGILDEDALYRALKDGRVAGAGIDVFAKEPTTDSPLFEFENVVVAPHLGASTAEAQEKAGTQVARSVKLALSGEFVPDAVNVQGTGVAEEIKPGLPLTEKLGRVFTSLAGALAARIDVEVRGEIAQHDVKVLELAALKGVFTDVVEDTVTFVNAPLLAKERGVEVNLVTSDDSTDWRNLISVRGVLADGTRVSVSGTLTGPRQFEKLVEINNYSMEIGLDEHMVFLSYEDRPGIVGKVGALLGDAQVNIAGMQVIRDQEGGKALIALTVDSAVPDEILASISAEIESDIARQIDLED
ncbi:phosphoglycerate dehydrogenase [Nocardiopsis exhalans]|uniref:D-3-phosphoglycerate dehydrogenase n=1 Tax=Nocardiopsis exhalans TaxID=163604 RepID=A0ABY5DAG8_9ACTN|nr:MULTISPECIES: phosphoglycerate dehydrogenase [Nocardiopsis]USY21346.1 phosphoglycerate dehydrogenase [Nocardiopsis exhalans]